MIELKISDYANEIMSWRMGHGFRTPNALDTEENRHDMLGKLMLVVSEVSEASEAVRQNDLPNFKEEIADAFIRLMDITAAMGIDIESEIRAKMTFNEKRPFKNGKLCSL